MKNSKRILEEANFIINNNATIRKTAEKFGLGKSTIHKDITKRLAKIDINIYQQVNNIMKSHLKERHINGGKATKDKYRN